MAALFPGLKQVWTPFDNTQPSESTEEKVKGD